MITLRRKLGWIAFGVALVAAALPAQAQGGAQAASAVTILRTNTDIKNGKIFAEIAFEGQGCREYNLKFKLKSRKKGDLGGQKVIVLNNPVLYSSGTRVYTFNQGPGTTSSASSAASPAAKLKNNDSVMYDLKLTGYYLEFPLPTGITPDDSIEVCMESIVFATVCGKCGVGGSDMVFTPNDIKPGCPYPNKGNDLAACYQRDSKAANWEAWIIDSRDCQPYRIVQMPDSRWWFAQNLNYHSQSDYGSGIPLEEKVNAAGTTVASNNSLLKTAWCPGGTSVVSTTTTVTGTATNDKAACKIYGALYPWATAMSLDGIADNDVDAALQFSMGVGAKGARRGVCPQGWFIPSRYDWGRLVNILESGTNTTPCSADGANDVTAGANEKNSPCFHNYQDVTTNKWAASRSAFRDLLSTDVAPARGSGSEPLIDGATTNYADTTRAKAYQPAAKLASPNSIRTHATDGNPSWNYFYPETAGTNKYGFSIKPAGVRAPNPTPEAFYYRGEFAGFWTSSHASTTLKPTYATAANAYMVGFKYNYRHNADFNSAIMSWAWDKQFGLSVRCVAAE